METVTYHLDWTKAYDGCAYNMAAFAELAKIDEGSVRQYLRGLRVPRKTNLAKLEKAMLEATQKPRLERHPSYGYATDEQIQRLKSIGVGPQMDMLLKQIARQTETKGKYIFAEGEVE